MLANPALDGKLCESRDGVSFIYSAYPVLDSEHDTLWMFNQYWSAEMINEFFLL